jgi:hypothetical protein
MVQVLLFLSLFYIYIYIYNVATRNRLFTPDLESDKSHVALRDNLNRDVTPFSSSTIALNEAAAYPNQ